MKCIAVYTDDFASFSDIFEKVLSTPLADNEEQTIDGIAVSDSGEVPTHYIDRMRNKHDVAVMKEKDRNITILQHGRLFEILLPNEENMVH
ncbi:MAG TPA: NAD/NADP transhydrogenase alpha subunit [Bacilli bacterium]